MTNPQRLELGAEVSCADGPYGELRRVVVDPTRQVVTHLVVEARHRTGLGRLVPIDELRDADGGITLGCGREALERFPVAERVIVSPEAGFNGAGEPMMTLPFYGLDPGAADVVSEIGGNADGPWVSDIVPDGEVEVAPHEHVHATDGTIGRLRGVVVDADDGYKLSHVLLQEGHLWGKREIAVPMGTVVSVDAGIRLRLSKKEVGALPPLATPR